MPNAECFKSCAVCIPDALDKERQTDVWEAPMPNVLVSARPAGALRSHSSFCCHNLSTLHRLHAMMPTT
jgi:uncharacterized protein VirK/YbjX